MASEEARIIDFQDYRRRRLAAARSTATTTVPPAPAMTMVWVPMMPVFVPFAMLPMPVAPFPV